MDENEEKSVEELTTEELKQVVNDTLEKVRTQALLLGAQAMCSVILQKIDVFQKQPGKRTMNDYKRLTKDIEQFCRTGVSRKVNNDGTTSEREESEGVVSD